MGCLHDTANIPTIRLRMGEGRSHPERESSPHPTHTGAKLLRRDAPSVGRSADPLEQVLLLGNLYWRRGASFGSSWSGGTSDSAPP